VVAVINKFLDFGCLSVRKITTLLFWIGAVTLIIAAIMQGYGVYLTHTYQRTVSQGDGWFTSMEVNNHPLGITYGIIFFVLGILLWRLICEIIYIILNYFKSNTNEIQSNKTE
jgi:hypothetical protein